MTNVNSIRFEVWHHATDTPDKKRRLAAFHFRFHAEAFIEAITKHPGNYEIIEVKED